ncbi:MAG: hypothetical protein ACI4EA_12890 [Candidatus Ornithomonoglobus sp.]
MTSSRSPNIKYNGSCYVDLTARDAISKADREQLTERRKRVMDKFYEIAAAEGLRIASYIKLEEIGSEEDV